MVLYISMSYSNTEIISMSTRNILEEPTGIFNKPDFPATYLGWPVPRNNFKNIFLNLMACAKTY